MLKFKKHSEDLILRVFLDKEDLDNFKIALKEALEHSLNLNSNQTAEFLAKYLDFLHTVRIAKENDDESQISYE
jgi:hypothetical protein